MNGRHLSGYPCDAGVRLNRKRSLFVLVALFLLAEIPVFAQGKEVNLLENKSTHFIVYSDPDVPKDFVKTMLDYAERYYKELTEKLGFTLFDYWTWDNRAKIYIYADQESYVRETGQPSWSGGIAAYDQKKIWTYPRGAGFFDSLLPHELGHIIFREVIGARAVPLWLEEGVASYLEVAKRFGSEQMVMSALQGNTFISLTDLSRIDGHALRSGGNVELFYAESISVIKYLLEKFGVDRFNRLCEKIRDGRKIDDALVFAYFDIRSVEDLGKFWEQSLKMKNKTML
jgi:hypothetical protein